MYYTRDGVAQYVFGSLFGWKVFYSIRVVAAAAQRLMAFGLIVKNVRLFWV